MSLIHYQLSTLQKQKDNQSQQHKKFIEQLYRKHETHNQFTPAIIDMSSEMKEVRRSKVTLNPNLVNATSSRSTRV